MEILSVSLNFFQRSNVILPSFHDLIFMMEAMDPRKRASTFPVPYRENGPTRSPPRPLPRRPQRSIKIDQVSSSEVPRECTLSSPRDVETPRSFLSVQLQDPNIFIQFRRFLSKLRSEENLDFWGETGQFSNSPSPSFASTIFRTYVERGSIREVNLTSRVVRPFLCL